MSQPLGFERAKLEIEGGSPLECWFNPSQSSIAKANEWTARPVVGSSLTASKFAGGQARELTIELLFDAEPDKDVIAVADTLFQIMEVDPALARGRRNAARPPIVTLKWGTVTSFKAVCRNLNVTFTLFKPDGSPIRAQATLTLVQVEKDQRSGRGTPARAQNPTTRSDPKLRSHVVRAGDSLQSIAFEHLGDATRWRDLALHNDIDDPLAVPLGLRLEIPLGTA